MQRSVRPTVHEESLWLGVEKHTETEKKPSRWSQLGQEAWGMGAPSKRFQRSQSRLTDSKI